MKILHVSMTIERGGAENQIVEIIDHQTENDIVSIVYFKGKDDWKDFLESRGVVVLKLNLNVFVLYKLIKLIKINRPDVIHAHLQLPELLSFFSLIFFPKIKFLIHKHNDENIKYMPISLQKKLFYLISLRAVAVIVISENVKKFVIKNHGINASKISVVYYGIDSSKFILSSTDYEKSQEMRKDYLKNHDFIIGTISRLHPQKSLDTLITSIFILIKKYNINVVLLIVGEGHLKKNLSDLVSRLGIENNVKFLGKRNDIPLLYKCFDLFVLSSIYEGLGLVLLEAMACNTPIIATNVGAIPEILGETGIIIEPRDPEKLSSTINYFFNELMHKKDFAKFNYTRINHLYNKKLMLERIDSIYANCTFKDSIEFS